jgi:hypothetical protein
MGNLSQTHGSFSIVGILILQAKTLHKICRRNGRLRSAEPAKRARVLFAEAVYSITPKRSKHEKESGVVTHKKLGYSRSR